MKKLFMILMVALFFVYSSVCLAGTPKGLEKKGKTPKGFSQGEKAGWEGDYPKGWDELSKEEKKEWQNEHSKDSDEVNKGEDENEDKAKKNKHKKQEKKGKKK